jgi:hypothetical protein
VVYEVGFGNGTNLDAYTNTITMTLPTGFDFVSASLAPTISGQTLSWDVGDLLADSEPQTIYVTATVAPSVTLLSTIETQAVIQSGTAEVEFANNTAVHTLFIGKYSFLPVILR